MIGFISEFSGCGFLFELKFEFERGIRDVVLLEFEFKLGFNDSKNTCFSEILEEPST